jgi:multiple sugar transport system permease protein
MTSRAGQPIIAAGRAAFVALYAIPVVYLFVSSFKSEAEMDASPGALLFHPDLSAYQHVWNPQLLSSALSSVQIALGTTVLVLVLGAPAAYALAHHRHVMASLAVGVVILLQMVPQATAIIPLFKILGAWGLLGSIVSVILADTTLLLPFAIILLRPFFLSVPREVEEAARVDGASGIRSFIAVSLPLARNGVVTVGILVFMIAWGEFLYAITLLNDPGSYPLTGLLAFQVTQFGIVWDRLFALAVLSSLPLMVTFLVARRRLAEGLSLGVGK